MENCKLVSVIIPTAQREPLMVKKAIESALHQTYPHIEILIIDDNTESCQSSAIRASTKDIPKVRYIKNIGEHGACSARNTGIACARGEFIAFLDDDDEWLPQKIELQMKKMVEEVIVVYCNGWRVDTRVTPITKCIYKAEGEFLETASLESLLENNHIGTTTQLLIRKSALEKIDGFDPAFPARQDYDLCLRLVSEGRVVGINKPLFYHTVHYGNQISKSSKASLRGYELLYRKHRDLWIKYPKALCKLFFVLSRMYKLQKHPFLSIQYYCRGVLLCPSQWKNGIGEMNKNKPV